MSTYRVKRDETYITTDYCPSPTEILDWDKEGDGYLRTMIVLIDSCWINTHENQGTREYLNNFFKPLDSSADYMEIDIEGIKDYNPDDAMYVVEISVYVELK